MNSFDINGFLKKSVSIGASEVHLRAEEQPIIRKDGKLVKIDMPKFTEKDLVDIINTIIPKMVPLDAAPSLNLDFLYEITGVSKFKINLSRQQGKSALAIKMVA